VQLLALVVDIRISSNFGLQFLGFPIPLMLMIVLPLVYIFSSLKRSEVARAMILATILFTALEFVVLTLTLTSPVAQQYNVRYAQIGVTVANIESNMGILSNALNPSHLVSSFNLYSNGIMTYLGLPIVLLAALSFLRFDRRWETIVLASFPIFCLLAWSTVVVVDVFQPRFILSVAAILCTLGGSALFSLVRLARGVNLRSALCVLIIMLMSSAVILSSSTAYAQDIIYVQGWNHSPDLGWGLAKLWIENYTTPKSIVGVVSADYFSWYVNRPLVFLWATPNLNMSSLTGVLRAAKINYLVVDYYFMAHNPLLSSLYYAPFPFLGASLDYNCTTPSGNSLIIYNVTTISYGTLTNYSFVPPSNDSKSWSPLLYYTNGTITPTSQGALFDMTVKNTPWPSASAVLRFSSPINLSNYSTLSFDAATELGPNETHLVVEIHTTDVGNYYAYLVSNNVQSNLREYTLSLNSPSGLSGAPSLSNVSSLAFIFGYYEVGSNVSFQIDDVRFLGQAYSLP
jgi:hypothetical protein